MKGAVTLPSAFNKMKKSLLITIAISSLIATGCKGEDAEVIDSATPAVRDVKFAGTADDRMVGVWKNDKSDLRYTFEKNGKFTNKGVVNSPGGPIKIDTSGEWGFENDTLYVKDSKEGVVIDYTTKLEGSSLTLTTRGEKKIQSRYTKEK
jgi:hypothetical protein